jgi:1-acyl-sn-glycerol-3-phosphate acyltransferase
MNNAFFRAVRIIGYPFRFKVLGTENFPKNSPMIIVSNHVGEVGPIAMMLSMPIQLHPWSISDMTDKLRAPDYIYKDFIQPVWKLKGWFGNWVAQVVGRIATMLINGLGAVAVDKQSISIQKAFKSSMQLLLEGKSILVFPEEPLLTADPKTGIKPFAAGFTWLCHLYEQKTGKTLWVLPAAVHAGRKAILLGEPRTFTFNQYPKREIARAEMLLECEIKKLYLQLDSRI